VSEVEHGGEIGTSVKLGVVVCGFDGSPAALDAARQAASYADAGARIIGVSSWDSGLAFHAGIHAGAVSRELREASEEALRAAAAELPDLEQILMRGPDVASLLAAAAEAEADLLCVGSHGGSRLSGVITGSVATALAHHAPCPVLIGRESQGSGAAGPILHATDGSEDSAVAGALAGRIATRAGLELRSLSVGEGDGDVAEQITDAANEMGAALLVVGARGHTGLRSLGSVSEKVAHRAPCSVLIVRPKAHPERA